MSYRFDILGTIKRLTTLALIMFFIAGCQKDDNKNPFNPPTPPDPPTPGTSYRPASIGIVGDTADVKTTTKGGVVIMGGGSDVDAAFRWMIERSGGGDVVIIRATGTDAYNPYVKGLGTVNSVETLKIDSRKLAEDEGVAQIIRNAEMLFIAGGDQSDYNGYWKNTKVMDAINYLLNDKKVPVGGTSAGAAILGNYYFSGERGSVTSDLALSNPYDRDITLYKDDFLHAPFLQNVITDQHFSQREREGRTVVFLGRVMTDWSKVPYGVAVDEATAVCIDEEGMAQVVGSNKAFFLKTFSDKTPEVFESDKSVTWDRDGEAVRVTTIPAKTSGNKFNVNTFDEGDASGSTTSWWSVANGKVFFH